MNPNPEFLALFLQHQDGIRAFIRSLVRDRGAADDVFQETSIVLWSEFDRYEPNRSFGAWARGIASNKVLKSYARNRRFSVALPPEAINAVAISFDERESNMEDERTALRACLEKLSDYGRQLLVLRYEHSLSVSALASRIARSEEAVHKALVRVRSALAKCVGLRIQSSKGTI